MIVVTGATGNVGRLVAQELAARGERIRLLVRDPARVPELPEGEVVRGEYGDAEALAQSLGEGDRVFMVSLHLGPKQRVPLHREFIEAATRARVGHIVYLSFTAAGPDARFLHARSHGATEALLRASGIPWTAIRNGMYADEIPGWFDPDGVAREPGGDGRMSFSYRPELARAIAEALTDARHQGQVHNVTTPESVSLAELARIASAVTGDDYRYEPASDESWMERWRAQGVPDWELEVAPSVYVALRSGEFDVVSDDYRRITGLEPLTIAQLIERMAEQMPLARHPA